MANTNSNPQSPTPLPPIKIAFVIDGEVVDILHTDERLAAIFLSEPKIIDITDRIEAEIIAVSSTYDEATDTFSSAEAPNRQLPVEG